jgi:predicted nucleic acid-binding protein
LLYFDSSAIVKLYVEEPESGHVRAFALSGAMVFTSDIAYPEVRAALAAARRDGRLSPSQYAAIKAKLDGEWATYAHIEVDAAVCRKAGDLADEYALRGFDAVHLACFAEIVGDPGRRIEFISFDARLSRAAELWARRRR